MVASLTEMAPAVAPKTAAWKRLPPRMRVLYISTRQRTSGWLAEAFAADSASKVVLEEAVGMAAGLARLRDDVFDAVLVSHDADELNALDMIEGYRTGGSDEPIIVLGTQSEQEMAALCYEVGADGYACVHTATTRNLIWVIARAVQRSQLVHENQQFTLSEQARLQREHDEAACLLRQQRMLLDASAAETESSPTPSELLPTDFLPAELIDHYRKLLRTYVIMGTGNLSVELKHLAELLVASGLTARQTVQLHLHVLEELVHGLGSRSTRHAMNRADLLVLEVLLHVADGYRRRYQERVRPPVQKPLPGME
jgi:DNA-binding response OmpR family regulator